MNNNGIEGLWGYLNPRSLDNARSINWKETKYNSKPNQMNANIS